MNTARQTWLHDITRFACLCTTSWYSSPAWGGDEVGGDEWGGDEWGGDE